MRDQFRAKGFAGMPRLAPGEFLVHFAGAVPQHQLDPGLRRHPIAEITVRQEDDLFGTHCFDNLHGIGRCAAGVGFSLDLGRGVDVADHRHARMARAQGAHVGGGDRGGQGTTGFEIRNQHALVRSQQLGAFSHEVDATHDDQVALAAGGGLGQCQRVAGDVGNTVEDLG